MKKAALIFFFAVIINQAFPQENNEINTKYYTVIFSSPAASVRLMETAGKLDRYIDYYNSFFHYQINSRFRIYVFNTEEELNGSQEMKNLPASPANPATGDEIFLIKPAARGFEIFTTENRFNEKSLKYFCFSQYIKECSPTLPDWIYSGSMLFLTETVYSPDKNTINRIKNMAMLTEIKNKGADNISFSDIEEILKNGSSGSSSLLWAFFDFIYESPERKYSRFLWDSIHLADRGRDKTGNTAIVYDNFIRWIDKEEFISDFRKYINSSETLEELAVKGIEYYDRGDFGKSISVFTDLTSFGSAKASAYYYLGLNFYSEKKYGDAENYYIKSMENGFDRGTASYALGLNAYAKGDMDKAYKYLSDAAGFSQELFGKKTETLLEKIRSKNAEQLF